MFHAISERIIVYAIKNGRLDRNMIDEYIYGLEISLSVLANYLSVILIGTLMGMFWQSALFLFLFVSVRRFGGGFHFSSQIMCFLSMCIICPLILLFIKYGGDNIMLFSIIMIVSAFVSFIIFPVPAIEKPLDLKEKVVYSWISRIMIIIISVIYAVLCFFQKVYIAKIISVTILAIAIFAILGEIKHKLYENGKAAP